MRPDFWLTVDDVKDMGNTERPATHLQYASTESFERIYDDDAAVRFIQSRTNIAERDVEKFVWAVNLYALGLGFTYDDEEVFGTTQAKLRRRYPTFFPPKNIAESVLDVQLERFFIALETGIPEELVARMQRAEEDYMRRIGIIG